MSMPALLITVDTAKCLPTKWRKKILYVYTMKHVLHEWTFETIMQNEQSQLEDHILYDYMYMKCP